MLLNFYQSRHQSILQKVFLQEVCLKKSKVKLPKGIYTQILLKLLKIIRCSSIQIFKKNTKFHLVGQKKQKKCLFLTQYQVLKKLIKSLLLSSLSNQFKHVSQILMLQLKGEEELMPQVWTRLSHRDCLLINHEPKKI